MSRKRKASSGEAENAGTWKSLSSSAHPVDGGGRFRKRALFMSFDHPSDIERHYTQVGVAAKSIMLMIVADDREEDDVVYKIVKENIWLI